MADSNPHLDSDRRSQWEPEADAEGHAFVATSAGAVHVRRAGSGTPLVLLHANGLSWREFEGVVGPLTEHFEVLAWDMPGHGESDPAESHASIERYAEILTEVLDQLGIERAVIAGSSVGAFIAMAFENQRPDRVLDLALIEFQFIPDRQGWAQIWGLVERNFAVPGMTRDQVQARLHRPVDDALVERWNIDRSRAGSRTMMNTMWAIRMFDAAASLRRLSHAPVVVFGEDSPTVKGLPNLESHLPDGSRVAVIPGSGHFVSIDAPADLVAELAASTPYPA